MRSDRAKVLYIAGWDRSGSTILDLILGQLPGFFSVGELVDLWDRGPDALCGCGCKVAECDVWRRIFLEAFDVGPDRYDFQVGAELRSCCVRSRHLCLLSSPALRRFVKMPLDPYLKLTRKLYRAISAVTGARVVVDSSKHPAYAYALGLSGVAELYIVHLVRDPRGCAYSWQASKEHPDPSVGRMPVMGPAKNALHWIFANTVTRALWGRSNGRYLRLRYEDFIARPKDSTVRILELVGESVSALPFLFLSEHSVSVQPVHGVSGNPVRFHTGIVELKRDEKWKTAMKPGQRFLVTALTAPALTGYGYSLSHEKAEARW